MTAEHCDVLIVGAGLSGIGAAVHLKKLCPDKSYLVLEGREAMGGTWDLFRYPGIRSDSDMHTLGYKFKPWRAEKAIADGPAILEYIHQTAAEFEIEDSIRYRHKVRKADWCSAQQRWLVAVEVGPERTPVEFSCNFLFMCAGYYSYDAGYTPEFPGREHFRGPVIHPQQWPQDLDYSGKRVVVIGSGATAMTLVPAMARDAAHVVMLQRSPTYIISRPDIDRLANLLRRVLPERWAYRFTRWKNITLQQRLYRKSRTDPEWLKEKLLAPVRRKLGPHYDVEKHFTPSYNPWDQRLCLIPDDDLLQAISSGSASVVTEEIDCFTGSGVRLQSGETLAADIIVTATGLQLVAAGEVAFSVDGRAVDLADSWTYRGVMYSGVPNLVTTFGYINASWTLRSDIIAEFVCGLVREMDARGAASVTPQLRAGEENMAPRPWVDDFSSGYMRRSMHLMPRQGSTEPWTNPQDYLLERDRFRQSFWNDGALIFQ